MRVIHALAAMLLIATHANHTHAQTCTNTVRNMTMCPILNGLSTNASAAEVAYYDEQMHTLIPYVYTQMAMQTRPTNTSLCTAHIHAYACAQAASTHPIQKFTIQEEKAKREDKAKREKLEEREKPSPKRQKHEDPPTQTHLDAIRAATEDIQVAIDAIFNAEGAPDLDDIATVVAANKNIVLLLDAINPPHTPRVQHKYAAELFEEASNRKGQQKPAPV